MKSISWNPVATFFAVAIVVGHSVAPAASSSESWKAECVGRMQISFPGEVEVAAALPKDFVRDVSGKGSSPAKFEDSQDASWSNFNFGGVWLISHPAKDEHAKEIHAAIQAQWQEVNLPENTPPKPSPLKMNKLVSKAWKGKSQSGNYLRAYLLVDRTVIRWAVGGDDKELFDDEKVYEQFIDNIRRRPLFDVPAEPGVCLPYLFIRDDGKQGRHIGMTYRLKAHPDITIWLEDSSAGPKDRRLNPLGHSTEAMINYFWNQRYYHRAIETQWPLRRVMKDTTLAGQPGGKTFVRITRDDKARTTDYGYLAAARGDPDAREDRPDIMLYVIQDSINATKQGIAPVTKKQFIDLAEKIAASVKRRETGGTVEGR